MPSKSGSYSHLGNIYGPGHILMNLYPIYSPKERRAYSGDPFYYHYQRGYLMRNLSCAKLAPVAGGEGQIVILPRGAQIPAVLDYYKSTYGKKQTGDGSNIRYFDNEHGYIDLVKNIVQETNYSVVTPTPLLSSHIDPRSFYVDAKMTISLNKKSSVHKLTSKAPKRVVVYPENFERAIFEQNLFLPCVIKGNTGCGGSTVFIVRSIEELAQTHKELQQIKTGRIVIEEYFDHDKSYNLQFRISKEGEISLLGISDQVIGKNGEYLGNIIDMELDHRTISHDLINAGVEVCEKAHQKGWYGLVGMDALYSEQDKRIRLIDFNFRWNGSSTLQLLRNTIAKRSGDRYVRGINICPKKSSRIGSAEDALRDLKKELSSHLFIIGAVNRVHREGRYRFRLAAGVTGNSTEEIQKRINALAKRYSVIE